MTDVSPDLEFWRDRYRSGRTPWDLGGVSRPALELMRRWGPSGGRVLVPGCGRGYEALYLAAKGYTVTAVDIAVEPLDELRAVAAARGLGADVLQVAQSDLFELPAEMDGRFDVVLEQTCLCALPPARHGDYEALLHRVLVPGGQVLGVFMETHRPGGPPYDNPPGLVFDLFGPERWEREGPIPVRPRNPARPGPEYLARFARRPARNGAN